MWTLNGVGSYIDLFVLIYCEYIVNCSASHHYTCKFAYEHDINVALSNSVFLFVFPTIFTNCSEHISAILCVTCSINKSFIISGADDSTIVIARLDTGKLVTKIEQHRAAVTALSVCTASDVLVSGSRDATICLWSLDNFSLLNMLQMNKPVLNLQISSDSVSVGKMCSLYNQHTYDQNTHKIHIILVCGCFIVVLGFPIGPL